MAELGAEGQPGPGPPAQLSLVSARLWGGDELAPSRCRPPPTLQWVVLMGRPTLEAITTVRADASSMLKPLQRHKVHEKQGTGHPSLPSTQQGPHLALQTPTVTPPRGAEGALQGHAHPNSTIRALTPPKREGRGLQEQDAAPRLPEASPCPTARPYLDGVMGVRSFPIVWMTLLPQTHKPMQIPAPP